MGLREGRKRQTGQRRTREAAGEREGGNGVRRNRDKCRIAELRLAGRKGVWHSQRIENARVAAHGFHTSEKRNNHRIAKQDNRFLANLLNDARPKTFHIFSSRFKSGSPKPCVDK